MKKLAVLLTILFSGLAFGQSTVSNPTWPAADTKGNAGRILEQVYGSYTSACLVDSNVDLFSTTLDAEAAAGQKTVPLTATTDLAAGDTIALDADNSASHLEVCVIDSVSAGVSVSCMTNLTYTQANGTDAVLTNRLGPLVANRIYEMYLVSTAYAGVAGFFKQGASTVVPTSGTSPMIIPTEKITFRVPPGSLYVGMIPVADDRIMTICPKGY